MIVPTTLLGFAAVALAATVPSMQGMENPTSKPSVGGFATCTTGLISVDASAMNEKFNYTIPQNQTVLTETLLDLVSVGSTLTKTIAGPNHKVNATFKISGTICIPKKGPSSTTIQFLTHGIGLMGSYWNFAKGYSYVDVAAQHGYPSFYYDRLGVGNSETPDAIQIVQAPLEVGIAHSLIEQLRAGKIGSKKYSKVVAAGQSFGSFITVGLTNMYPMSIDAAVLTGFSVNQSNVPAFLSGANFVIASKNQPKRFKGLSNGYIVPATESSNQLDFFKFPGFAQDILNKATAGKGSATLGEFFSMSAVVKPAKTFKGPVTVVNGVNDFPFCSGDCRVPTNQAAAVKAALFPAVTKFSTYLAPVAGHALNLHYSAEGAFEFIQKFVKNNAL